MFEKIRNTHAVIFDMRGYPKGTAWPIAPRLTELRNAPAARFSTPVWNAISFDGIDSMNRADFSFLQRLPDRQGDPYKGKVVRLINEEAVSQAEPTHSTLPHARPAPRIPHPAHQLSGSDETAAPTAFW